MVFKKIYAEEYKGNNTVRIRAWHARSHVHKKRKIRLWSTPACVLYLSRVEQRNVFKLGDSVIFKIIEMIVIYHIERCRDVCLAMLSVLIVDMLYEKDCRMKVLGVTARVLVVSNYIFAEEFFYARGFNHIESLDAVAMLGVLVESMSCKKVCKENHPPQILLHAGCFQVHQSSKDSAECLPATCVCCGFHFMVVKGWTPFKMRP